MTDEKSETPQPSKRRRGRPRKTAVPDEHVSTQDAAVRKRSPQAGSDVTDFVETSTKPRRGRPRKTLSSDEGTSPAETSQVRSTSRRQSHVSSSSQMTPQSSRPSQQTTRSYQQTSRSSQQSSRNMQQTSRSSQQFTRASQQTSRNPRHQQQNQYGSNRYQQTQNNNRRRGRHTPNMAQTLVEPRLSRTDLSSMSVAELRSHAASLSVEYVGVRKSDLVEAVYVAAAHAEGFRSTAGVLDITSEGYGFIRTGNYMAGDEDAFVPQQLIKHLGLRRGDWIEGTVRPSRPNDKYPALQRVHMINGLTPDAIRSRPRFRDLTPVYPNEPLTMEHGKDSITGRAIDLVAPIGKGQRGLIVSPPKAGKTTVLKRICESIAANNPEVYLICLLVDERPEEVTDMERSIRGDVVASTFDMPADNHTSVSELVIERAKRLVEMGRDVVVVLDSITRLARAYNLAAPASGRILSGGVDSAALYPPKRFLGAARNIEHGGSLTILASALVDTGSKMDEVIFEEFKGTGNMELKLDRELADKRIFPAIDPITSGTRNEELLIDPEMQPFVWGLRRILANMNSTERAESSLIKSLRATRDNQEFLIRSAKKAQQNEYADAL